MSDSYNAEMHDGSEVRVAKVATEQGELLYAVETGEVMAHDLATGRLSGTGEYLTTSAPAEEAEDAEGKDESEKDDSDEPSDE